MTLLLRSPAVFIANLHYILCVAKASEVIKTIFFVSCRQAFKSQYHQNMIFYAQCKSRRLCAHAFRRHAISPNQTIHIQKYDLWLYLIFDGCMAKYLKEDTKF